MADRYRSFAHLNEHEVRGRDYQVTMLDRPHSPVVVLAPHGGSIEVGTSEIASLIAGDDHSLFAFEGLKPYGRNRDLHITSHQFDHPECLALTGNRDFAVAVHGCKGESHVYIGGLDTDLGALVKERLEEAGFAHSVDGHRYPGRNPQNICNRVRRGRGVQLEFTHDLRHSAHARGEIAMAVRSALADYLRLPGHLKLPNNPHRHACAHPQLDSSLSPSSASRPHLPSPPMTQLPIERLGTTSSKS